MKKIAIILANEMNDIDLFIPLAIWRQGKISVDLISIEKKNSVMMESGTKVGCTAVFETVNMTQYHAIYIPGGPGVCRLSKDNWPVKIGQGVLKLNKAIENFRIDKQKMVFVTADSSSLLNELQLIGNARIAGFDKSYVRDPNIKEEILVNNNLVSVVGYWALTDFAIETLGLLVGQEQKEQIAKKYYND